MIYLFDNLCYFSQNLDINIPKKEGDLKEIYTARLEKLRLHMKPIGEYPYNKIEIVEIEFLKIDEKHYKK